MAVKKSSARERAERFLVNVGTAGGPVGAEGLYTFGAANLAAQVESGNIDQYAAMRGQNGSPVVGQTGAPAPAMPRDLDSAYLKLNLPGSPLTRNALLSPQMQSAAEFNQNSIITNEQYLMMQGMPQTGMLPLGLPPANNSKGGSK